MKSEEKTNLDKGRKKSKNYTDKQIRSLLKSAKRFWGLNSYEQAIEYASRAYALVTQYDRQNAALLEETIDILSSFYFNRGKYNLVESLYLQLLNIREKKFGLNHLLTATSMNNLGTLYQEKGSYEKAESLLKQALEIRREILGEMHSDVAQSLDNLALLYCDRGRYIEAEQLYLRALPIWRASVGDLHPDVAICLNNLGLLYYKTARYREAESYYKEALSIRRAFAKGNSVDVATSLDNLAVLYRVQGDYGQAETLYQQALKLRREILGENHPDVGLNENNLAVLYEQTGRYEHAESLYKHALALLRKAFGEIHPSVLQSMSNLSTLYRSMGNYTQAMGIQQHIYSTLHNMLGEDHPLVAQSAINLGALSHEMGDFAQAERFYRRGLASLRRTFDVWHPSVAIAFSALASLYRSIGDYIQAENLYLEALEIRRNLLGSNHPEVAGSLNALALLFHEQQKDERAEELYNQALEISEASFGEQHPEVADILSNLGTLYMERGEYKRAEALYHRALKIRRTSLKEKHPSVGNSLNNLAALARQTGNYKMAEELYLQTLAIWETSLDKNHPDVAVTLANLAFLYAIMKRPDKAFMLMQQSSLIYDHMIKQIFSIGSDNQRLMYQDMIHGHFAAFLSLVLFYYAQNLSIVQEALDLVFHRKAIVAESLTSRREAVLRGHYPELAPQLEELHTIRMQIARLTLAGADKEKLEHHQQILKNLYAQRGWLESYLAHQVPDIDMTKANRQAVATLLPPNSVLIEFVRVDMVNFWPEDASLTACWKPAHYLAFVMQAALPDSVQLIDLGEAQLIDQEIAAFKVAITQGYQALVQSSQEVIISRQVEMERGLRVVDETSTQRYRAIGERLRRRLFDPLRPALGTSVRLFIAPDGDLALLPFEVLPCENEQYLLDNYSIGYLSVGRDLLRFKTAHGERSGPALVIADPDFDLHSNSPLQGKHDSETSDIKNSQLDALRMSLVRFPRLQGTRAEGEHIANLLGVVPLLGEAALEATVKACRSPYILHFATHGIFLPDNAPHSSKTTFIGSFDSSMDTRSVGKLQVLIGRRIENALLRSSLVLAGVNTWDQGGNLPPEAEDGLLTAEDITGLDLLDTELVVLSACETGVGAVHIGEGVFGLRRAFMLAGAKRLVMSLWKVPDRQTEELMGQFYQTVLEGLPGAEALRNAQLTMKHKYPHPFFWGAFIYQGDFNPFRQRDS